MALEGPCWRELAQLMANHIFGHIDRDCTVFPNSLGYSAFLLRTLFLYPSVRILLGGFIMNIRKCAVIGCGYVGATTAFALLQSGLFSEMVLIDQNRKKALGEAMDLSHSVPFVKPRRVRNTTIT